ALATMIFLKHDFLPLVISDTEHRESYLHSLESADTGDLAPLVSLFANIQTKDLEDAITFVREIRGAGIREIAEAAADAAKRQVQESQEKLEVLTRQLSEIAENRFREVSFELEQAFDEVSVKLEALVSHSDSSNEYWWSHQILTAARQYQYYAEMGRPRKWVRLRLRILVGDGPAWHIAVSFHHKEARIGLMAAVMFMTT
ncbi:MAG: hypothetical protein ACR2PL_12640, partial [Dehalococcoidia bacterium]